MTRARIIAVAVVLAVCAWPLTVFSMRHYVTEVDNDEVMYFLLVKIFRSQGFNGGYSFVNDRIPAAPIHFDQHGPGTVLLYSSLSRIVGWTNYSPYLANLILFAGAWLLLAFALRRRPINQLAVTGFVLANGYFFLFLPSAMQESFHISVAIALAALWYMAVEDESAAAWVGAFALALVSAMVRYAWVAVIPCLAFSLVMQRTKSMALTARLAGAAVAAVAIFGVAALAAVKLTLWWGVAPVTAAAPGVLGMPRVGNGFSTEQLRNNLSALVHFRTMRIVGDYAKFFSVCAAVTLAGLGAIAVRARGQATREAAAYSVVVFGMFVGAQIVFYEVDGWKEFRVLAPAHAFAGLAFLSRADLGTDAWSRGAREVTVGIALLVVMVNAMFTIEGVEARYWYNWTNQSARIDQDGKKVFASLTPHFEFRAGDSSFCKTVYGDSEVLADPRLVYLPDGFSLSVLDPDVHRHLPVVHGKYALVKKPAPTLHQSFDWEAAFAGSHDWRAVTSVEDFTLYRSTVHCLS